MPPLVEKLSVLMTVNSPGCLNRSYFSHGSRIRGFPERFNRGFSKQERGSCASSSRPCQRHTMCTVVLRSTPEGLFQPLLQFRGSSGACSYRSDKTWVFPPPAHHKSLSTRPLGSSRRAEATASWLCCNNRKGLGAQGKSPPNAVGWGEEKKGNHKKNPKAPPRKHSPSGSF